MERDTAFEMATSGIRYGAGITAEVGMDLADMGLHRVLVVTDANLAGANLRDAKLLFCRALL